MEVLGFGPGKVLEETWRFQVERQTWERNWAPAGYRLQKLGERSGALRGLWWTKWSRAESMTPRLKACKWRQDSVCFYNSEWEPGMVAEA